MRKLVRTSVAVLGLCLPVTAHADEKSSTEPAGTPRQIVDLQHRVESLQGELASVTQQLASIAKGMDQLRAQRPQPQQEPRPVRPNPVVLTLPAGHGRLVVTVPGATRIWLHDRASHTWRYADAETDGKAKLTVPTGTYGVFVQKPRSDQLELLFDMKIPSGQYREVLVNL